MSYLAETTARLIGVRRTVQARAILTLTKHLVEGSQHRYQRLGPQQYMLEYDQVRLAIVHPTVARSLFEDTDEPTPPQETLGQQVRQTGEKLLKIFSQACIQLHQQRLVYGAKNIGGYTGPSQRNEPAGIVHRGEYWDRPGHYLGDLADANEKARGYGQALGHGYNPYGYGQANTQ